MNEIGQIIGIYSGFRSTYILNSKFELFSCGGNKSGQLCLGYFGGETLVFKKINFQFNNKP
jgi:hypothetical protein